MKSTLTTHTFLPATNSDLNELSALVNAAYRGDPSRMGWTTEADYLDGQRTDPTSLKELIEKPNAFIFCLRAAADSTILGCVYLEMSDADNERLTYLGMLTVNPTLQNKGTGRQILDFSEQHAVGAGSIKMKLGVIQLRTSLIEWYERRGYTKTGQTKAFPYGDSSCGIPKRPDLYFVMFEKNLAHTK